MAYALGVGQSDRREQSGQSPSQASGLTTSNTAAGGGAPSSTNSAGLEKRVGSTQSPGVSNTSSKSPDDFTRSNAASTTAIIDRNQNVDQSGITNKITQDAQNQANQQTSDINKKVTDYNNAQTANTKAYAVGPTDQDIQGAVGGDATSTANLQKALNLQAGKVDDFNAGTYDPIKANEYLRGGDISSVLLNRGNQNYTSGMAALDNLMFGKAGGFQQAGAKVNDLQSQINNAYSGATNANTGVQALQQKAREAAVGDVVGKARTGLSSAEQGILSNAAAQAKTGDASRAQALDSQKQAQRAQVVQSFDDQIADIQKIIQQEPSQAAAGQQAIAQLNAKKANPDQFINYNAAQNTQDNYITGDNAAALNRIHQLLGIGGPVVQAGQVNQGGSNIRSNDINDVVSQLTTPVRQGAATAAQAWADKQAADAAEAARQDAIQNPKDEVKGPLEYIEDAGKYAGDWIGSWF